MVYQIERTGRQFRKLSDAHDQTQIGDLITYDGEPAFRVTSRTKLSFIYPTVTRPGEPTELA